MDACDLHLNIDYVGTSGIVLSPEQKAALQTSLVIQQNHYKFHKIYFWGKILGVKDDYYIAQGSQRDELAETKTLYRYSIFDFFFNVRLHLTYNKLVFLNSTDKILECILIFRLNSCQIKIDIKISLSI